MGLSSSIVQAVGERPYGRGESWIFSRLSSTGVWPGGGARGRVCRGCDSPSNFFRGYLPHRRSSSTPTKATMVLFLRSLPISSLWIGLFRPSRLGPSPITVTERPAAAALAVQAAEAALARAIEERDAAAPGARHYGPGARHYGPGARRYGLKSIIRSANYTRSSAKALLGPDRASRLVFSYAIRGLIVLKIGSFSMAGSKGPDALNRTPCETWSKSCRDASDWPHGTSNGQPNRSPGF